MSSESENSAAQPPAAAEQCDVGRTSPLGASVLLALLAGLVAWAVIQATYPVFEAPPEVMDPMAGVPAEVQKRLDRYNGMFALAVTGGLLGAVLAAGEAVLRRSWRLAVLGLFVSGLLAAVLGCVAGYAGHLLYEYLRQRGDLMELQRTLLVQAVLLGLVGTGVGLGVGVTVRCRGLLPVVSFGAGILGGVLAGLLYTIAAVLVGFIVPVITDTFIPGRSGERILWIGLTALVLGIVLSAAGKQAARSARGAAGESRDEG